MAERRVDWRLGVILSANVVGYSRPVEADEVGTSAAMRARGCGLWTPIPERHGGWVMGMAGESQTALRDRGGSASIPADPPHHAGANC
jgi:hypothetical protein